MGYIASFGSHFPLDYVLKDISVFKADPSYVYEVPKGSRVAVIISDANIYIDVREITDTSTQGMLLLSMQYHEVPVSNVRKLYFYTESPPATVRVLVVG